MSEIEIWRSIFEDSVIMKLIKNFNDPNIILFSENADSEIILSLLCNGSITSLHFRSNIFHRVNKTKILL